MGRASQLYFRYYLAIAFFYCIQALMALLIHGQFGDQCVEVCPLTLDESYFSLLGNDPSVHNPEKEDVPSIMWGQPKYRFFSCQSFPPYELAAANFPAGKSPAELGYEVTVEGETDLVPNLEQGNAKDGTVTWEFAKKTADDIRDLMALYVDAGDENSTRAMEVAYWDVYGCVQCKARNSSELFQPCTNKADCKGVPELPGFHPSKFPMDLRDSLRGLSSDMLTILGGCFCIQAFGAIVAAVGSRYFFWHQWKEWANLGFWEARLGCITKKMPLVNRLVNVVMGFLVGFAFWMYNFLGVCEDVTNSYNEKTYYPIIELFSMVNLLLFAVTCSGGTLFRNYNQVEVAFINPDRNPSTMSIDEQVDRFTWKALQKTSYRCCRRTNQTYKFCGPS